MTASVQENDGVDLVRKAVNLFTYLGSVQNLLNPPIYTVDQYETVHWFAMLPEHPAIRSAHRVANPDRDTPLLEIDRLPKTDPPAVPELLHPWLDGPTNVPDRELVLRSAIYVEHPRPVEHEGSDSSETEVVEKHRIELAEAPEVSAAFEQWLTDWRLWADQERRDAVVRELYKELFQTQLTATDHAEQFELVLGIGCLTWRPEGHVAVKRHLLTAPVDIKFDEGTGTLSVVPAPAPQSLTVELDMLDPALIPSPEKIDELRRAVAEFDGHLLDSAAVGEICRRLTNRLDAAAEYDEEALQAADGAGPRVTYAPAIILRRRTKRGLQQIYQQIVDQIQQTGEIPAGVLPLIDPDRQPTVERESTPGAVVTVDGDDFLPLPVNDKQRQIVERVDRSAQTVVQGPPGTGKTHTAAVLVSHLLAQGKRVLITAHTDRALQEVRNKLPREIRDLAVSVIGNTRSEMAELRTAVDSIAQYADDFDPAESERKIAQTLDNIDKLRRRRAETYKKLIEIRCREVETRTDGPEEGTLAAIAYRHLQSAPEYSWIRGFEVDPHNEGTSVTSEEISWWREILLDRDVADNEEEASRTLPALEVLAPPQDFVAAVEAEREAIDQKNRYNYLIAHETFDFVRTLAPQVREELRARVSELADQATALERRAEPWINEALRDVRSGRQHIWQSRSEKIKSLAVQAEQLLDAVGDTTTIEVKDGDVDVHQQLAKSLLAYLESGGKLKTQPDGSPKIGAFTSKTVKAAVPFFAGVKVNGSPAVTNEQLSAFIAWVDAGRILRAMDQAWPSSVTVPDEDTLAEALHWHRTEVDQLDRVLALGARLDIEREWFQANGLPVPDWNNLAEILRYAELVAAASAVDGAERASEPVERLSQYLAEQARFPNPPSVVHALLDAVRNRDTAAYATGFARLQHLYDVAARVRRRDEIRTRLERSAPGLAAAIEADPAAPEWVDRLPTYQEAWRWEMTGRWIMAQEAEDVNTLKAQLNRIEDDIRSEVVRLAAERAWGHAVAPGRLTGRARADLKQYAQLVAALGKGTGKYAEKRRAEIAEAMERCRPAVPVWIMPIYRIAEQIRVKPNLFDVVIVDEASQAGLEATFLQYLAPKIVVIGDDKQVSPSAVGVDQQQLRDLANLYLPTDRYRASWQNPRRSFFDEANMRFGGRITLVEHRRCVPEIIGFSNRIAYEPEGIRLIPVRQYGSDRLEPIKVVYVKDGYESGRKTNIVEARAIVEQIKNCLGDPRYDGKTFGVISLRGNEQARLIQSLLLDEVPEEEITARQLRCGDPPDFQGSERDVVFLSMVKAPSEDRRITALVGDQHLQRFNVAASRAKDQMWVFHSMPREALTNPEDLRYQLLEYCYGVINRLQQDDESLRRGVVPEDELVAPFDSLFEQRVYNRLIERGFVVEPQYETMGYRIDLVVIGTERRLAVECDGDHWHGPDVYEQDLARQRELERCGWQFFRIRESMFYADMPGTLAKLWEKLEQEGIRPADWSAPHDTSSEDGVEVLAQPAMTTEVIDQASANGSTATTAPVAAGTVFDEVDSDLVEAVEEVFADVSFDRPEAPATTEGSSDLPPYVAFRQPLPPVRESSLNEVVANVVRIIEVEGPVLGPRVHQAYREAYGGSRVGRDIARRLNQALTAAERRGLIVSSNPLQTARNRTRTYRLPGQPEVLPRQLGPRTLELVPPEELAHHLAQFWTGDDTAEEKAFRAVLEVLGLKRLTNSARVVLDEALRLVRDRES